MLLVAGATGNVGSALVDILTAAGHRIRTLTRNPLTTGPQDEIQHVIGDLNKPKSLDGAFTGVKAVFTLAGYDDMPALAATMRDQGVEHVVLMTGGSAGIQRMDNAISRYMTLSERAIRESGMTWTFLRPRAFMSNSLRWAPQLRAGNLVRVPFSWRRTAFIDPGDIAAVAARALVADEHRGAVLELTGPDAILPAEQVEILGAALGRKLRFEAVSNDEARIEMESRMPKERVDAYFGFYVDDLIDESVVFPAVGEVVGRPPRDYRTWAADNAHRLAA
ncbi:NAD(P)H-binding protein [Streptodolium elevatio]